MKKKKKDPVIKEHKPSMSPEQLSALAESIKGSSQSIQTDDSADSYYKAVLSELYNDENIEKKTEYLNVTENYVGTKLSFLARYGNMPFLNNFVDIFERKRISLERKGRKEIIMGLQDRAKDEAQQQIQQLKGLFGA